MSETAKHSGVKMLLETKLKEWFGLSITEYQSSGHELDVVGMTPEGVKIYIEVIWTHSGKQFYRDMSMLQQSDADVKAVAGSPEVLADPNMLREFIKVAVAETEKNVCIHPEILDGDRILSDSEYVDHDLKSLLALLVDRATKKFKQGQTVSQPYFEQRLSEIVRPVVENGEPRVQIVVGPIVKGDEYLKVADKNISLLQSFTPSFLVIRDSIPRRDKYEFESYEESFIFEVYPDGYFCTCYPNMAKDGIFDIGNLIFCVSSFLFYAARVMKIRGVTARQRIRIELSGLRDKDARPFGTGLVRRELYRFRKDKLKNIFESDFDPSEGWSHLFAILCGMYREILLELGVTGMSESAIRSVLRTIVTEIIELRTQYTLTSGEVVPPIELKEVFT